MPGTTLASPGRDKHHTPVGRRAAHSDDTCHCSFSDGLLGEGIIGWIIYNDREYEREYGDGAATSFGDVFSSVADPYKLLKEYPKVAVLTDGVVASSGEAIVVFFRGRPGTRSFGTPTCGHHHLQQGFPLNDGATLFLVSGQHADRMKRRYGGPIDPDEIIANPGEVVNRAVAWLLGGA